MQTCQIIQLAPFEERNGWGLGKSAPAGGDSWYAWGSSKRPVIAIGDAVLEIFNSELLRVA